MRTGGHEIIILRRTNEDQVRRASKIGVDDPTLIEPYDESYLDGFADLPMNFLQTEFCNRFSGKDDPHLHITSYILAMSAIRDRSVALKVMFTHSLTGDATTWYNEFVRDYPEAPCREMFKRFIAHLGTKKPQPVSVGELVALKQGSDKPFINSIDWFTTMASKVTKCPLSHHVKISIILENANNEYKTFFNHGGVPLMFNIMLERIALYKITKS
ncbi:hypothetical protein AMTR_s00180p00021750 [Amborella trichopoda]|uniref:Retrotransposon gag domain-containing protein n=1 Tax=Amborella trichopoda TaxID=13333 RepID=W1PX76_AMBTC|nr:hypothetical protein AMTR_s00180p00021750 [Amborella trichopoda]